MIGMTIAVLATVLGPHVTAGGYAWIIGAMVVGAHDRPVRRARRQDDADAGAGRADAQPGRPRRGAGRLRQLHRSGGRPGSFSGAEKTIHEIEIYIGVLIGAVTFSGSLIAFGKLSGKISGKPMLLAGAPLAQPDRPARRDLVRLAVHQRATIADGMTPLIVMTVIALLFGIHMVMAIGGADMPVVVSMLNSYSGWAAAATGFMLSQRPADRHRRAGRLLAARSSPTSCAAR